VRGISLIVGRGATPLPILANALFGDLELHTFEGRTEGLVASLEPQHKTSQILAALISLVTDASKPLRRLRSTERASGLFHCLLEGVE
jgi:hypothetical protein